MAAPGQGLEPGHQLLEREWFGEIVVGADFETANPVVHGIERRQHQHGRRDVLTPQLAAQLEPGAAGEAYIEHQDVVVAGGGLRAALGERHGEGRVDPVLAQAVAEQARKLGIVFHDQHAHGQSIAARAAAVQPARALEGRGHQCGPAPVTICL